MLDRSTWRRTRTMVRRPAVALTALAMIVTGGALAIAAPAASAADAPTMTVTPAAGLDPAGATVTVTGAGFSTAGSGVYVAIASVAKFSPTSMDAFGPAKWVHLGATPSAGQDVLNADGTFATTLDVAAVFGAGAGATNCLTEQCAIFTFAAHGSSDRSQDTTTSIHFLNPKITVTPTSGLSNGASLSVSGTGFIPGKGVYVAETVAKPASGPPSNFTAAAWVQSVGSDGTFTTTVTAADVFTPQGSTTATDCRAVACFVAAFNDHTDIMNRSQDVWVPISFADAPTETPTETPAGLAVSVTPDSGLAPTGATVTVTGTGFPTAGPGIYVGIASVAKFSPTSMDAFGPTKWVHLGATPSAGQDVLNADGSFEITLDVTASFGTGAAATDCLSEQCAIFTFAAHGSSDRSQDSSTPIGFTGAQIDPTPTPTPTTSAPTSGAGTAAVGNDSVAPGDEQTVTAAGFTPGEIVQATLHSDPVDLGTVTASSTGTVALTFTVPAGLDPGLHSVTLLGLTSGVEATATFTVAAAGAEVPTLASTGTQVASMTVVGVGVLVGGVLLLLAGSGWRPRRKGSHA